MLCSEVVDLKRLANAVEVLGLVDLNGVGLDLDVLGEYELFSVQILEALVGLVETLLEASHGVLDLVHLLDELVLGRIADQLDLRPIGANVEARVRQLQVVLLVEDGLLHILDVLLHVVDELGHVLDLRLELRLGVLLLPYASRDRTIRQLDLLLHVVGHLLQVRVDYGAQLHRVEACRLGVLDIRVAKVLPLRLCERTLNTNEQKILKQ